METLFLLIYGPADRSFHFFKAEKIEISTDKVKKNICLVKEPIIRNEWKTRLCGNMPIQLSLSPWGEGWGWPPYLFPFSFGYSQATATGQPPGHLCSKTLPWYYHLPATLLLGLCQHNVIQKLWPYTEIPFAPNEASKGFLTLT